MLPGPPGSTRTNTRFPYTTFFRSPVVDSVRVQRPRIALVREDVTRFNFSDIQQKLADMAAAQPQPEQPDDDGGLPRFSLRSEEHTSELQSLMRNSYAAFCLKKNNHNTERHSILQHNNLRPES